MAAKIDYHKFSGLKQFILSKVLETRSPKSRCQGHIPSLGSRRQSVSRLFQFLLSAGIAWLEATSPVWLFILPSPLCVSQISLFLCLVTTLMAVPWLVWLSGSSAGLQIKRLLVQFPVRTRAWGVGQVPSWGQARGNQSVYLSHIDVSLPLFIPPFPSLKINK